MDDDRTERRFGFPPEQPQEHVDLEKGLAQRLVKHLAEEPGWHEQQEKAVAIVSDALKVVQSELTGITAVIGSVRGIRLASGLIIGLLSVITVLFIWVLRDKNQTVTTEFEQIHATEKETAKTLLENAIKSERTITLMEGVVKDHTKIMESIEIQLRSNTAAVGKVGRAVAEEKARPKLSADNIADKVVDKTRQVEAARARNLPPKKPEPHPQDTSRGVPRF